MSTPTLPGTPAGTASVLSPGEDPGLPARLALSARAVDGVLLPTAEFDDWLEGRRGAHPFRVERIPFAAADGWSFDPATGNLGHRSGRFFTVEGLRVRSDRGPYRAWHQPVINQPEVGILGILMKDFGGVPHFLMQAKMEPGNTNLLQLSPTVQATRSNYTRVHRGAAVRYIEHFAGPGRGRVVADVLQSEHGAWFYRKHNRNMLVETDADVPVGDDFCWLTLGQINTLLGRDNVVNMDSRTVLSCLAPFLSHGRDHEPGAGGALTPTPELLSWITGQRSDREVETDRVPLRETEGAGWHRGADEIAREDGRFFSVQAVSVEAGSREVTGWSQPLFAPRGPGVVAFVVREFGGVLHLLMRARAEPGFRETVELGPTVQCVPENYDPAHRPHLLDHVLAADPSRVLYDVVHSEEGGRFLNAVGRHLIVRADDSFPAEIPDDCAWFTLPQLSGLLRHGHYVSVQARTLLACLHSLG
ncbi:NDP-hexose 2,3-dehydratase family protein [Streptomyces sp. ISL-11]|uniref:NDP-hexose 2,3-dehydratase family protein n=1 Tax=Streptomyces sp. ISL-11 TaxID=2819174 RepID=UPI001BEB8675|nr:NDP-hexose 2,3-dehydratase family protein [Streptomyces sp. ISL-11]MBT2383224.1 NDP-hexose 2,3-dehydratase family protein [Streptomyces sp. ISL-11]